MFHNTHYIECDLSPQQPVSCWCWHVEEKSCGQNKISIKLVVHRNAFKNKTFFLQPSSKSIKATSHFNFRLQLKFLIGTLKLFYIFLLASKLFLSLFQSNIGYFSFKTFNFNYVFVAARTKILKYPFPI